MYRISIALLSLLTISGIARAEWQNTQTIGGMQTEIYMPTSKPALNDKRALTIMLHGCNQTAKFFKDDGNWAAPAEEYGMVVAIPLVPNGGKIEGCWDYFGTGHTRTNKYNGYLLNMVDELLADNSYNIDPKQVYIVGLSSGGGQAMVQACLAPEKYAGVAVASTPALGTNQYNLTYVPYGTTASSTKNICEDYAGTNIGEFQTQIAAVAYGDNGTPGDSGTDGKLLKSYSTMNADMFALIYGADSSVAGDDIPPVANTTGAIQKVWNSNDQQVVSKVEIADMGHAWASGDLNPTPAHAIGSAYIDYPAFLTKWFFDNNRRADRVTNAAPELAVNVDVADYDLTVSGNVSDSDGTVASLTLSLENTTGGYNYGPFDIEFDANGDFNYTVTNLTDGMVTVSLVAADDLAAETPYETEIQVGELPDEDPVITLEGDNPLELVVGFLYVEPGFSASDAEDGDITANVVVNDNIHKDVAGEYQVTYTVTDSGDNTVEVTRTVIMVEAPACEEFTATLSAHESAGRAYSQAETTGQTCYGTFCFGGTTTTTYYAQGTDENLGTNGNASVTLKTVDNGYATGSCPTDPVAPVLVSYQIASNTFEQLVVTGTASDADGDIDRVVLGLGAASGFNCEGTTSFTCTLVWADWGFDVGNEASLNVSAWDTRNEGSNIEYFTATRPEQQAGTAPVITNLNYTVDVLNMVVTADITDVDGDLYAIKLMYADESQEMHCDNTGGNQYTCTITDHAPGTYDFKVRAIDSEGNESDSADFSVTFEEAGECISAINSEHVAAGRAYEQYGILVYATGSAEYLGTNTSTTSLEETSPGNWAQCL